MRTSTARSALALGFALLAAIPALAQTQVFRSVTAPTGKVTRLYVEPALKRDCTPGSLADIRVVTAPKNGALAIRKGKLTTPAAYRCPNVKTEVQAMFYKPNPRYSGPDEVTVETKNADGATQTLTIKITVAGSGGAAPGKTDDKNTLEL